MPKKPAKGPAKAGLILRDIIGPDPIERQIVAAINEGKDTLKIGDAVLRITAKTKVGSGTYACLWVTKPDAEAVVFEKKLKELIRACSRHHLPEKIIRDFLAIVRLALARGDARQARDKAMIEKLPREIISSEARRKAESGHKGSPKGKAMLSIREEFDNWQAGRVRYRNDAEFAKKMQAKHASIANEGSIKNACARWRKSHLAG